VATGGAVLIGLVATAGTTAVGFEVAVADPAPFVAVTRTRRRWPTSALATT
jgi:hypothetical protein